VLEGHDAAGKGGVIRRLAWALDPRSLRVHSITAPSPEEARQHWLKRFWARVPDDGEWVVFDRSWYGRVLVERVEGFARPKDWKRAYDEINAFEQSLADEGVRIVKLLLEIDPETQFARFKDRFETPRKRWKLTEEDLRNRARHEAYETAFRAMVKRTGTDDAPWIRVDARDKASTRVEALSRILQRLGRDQRGRRIDLAPPPSSPAIQQFFEAHRSDRLGS